MRRLRLSPSLGAYTLLDSLVKENQFIVALCLFSAMVPHGYVSYTNVLTYKKEALQQNTFSRLKFQISQTSTQ